MPIVEPSLPPEATHLSQSDACIGDDGTRELCARLAHHANLTSLDLRGCQIHASGAAAIAALLLHQSGPPIVTLSLEWNNIGTSDAGPKALAAALATSRSLSRSVVYPNPNSSPNPNPNRNRNRNADPKPNPSPNLPSYPSSLDLRNNHLGPTAVAALADGIARSATLRSIDLRWNAAGAPGGHALEEALKGNHTLLRAQLSGNRAPAQYPP